MFELFFVHPLRHVPYVWRASSSQITTKEKLQSEIVYCTWLSSAIELLMFFLLRLVTRYRICQKRGDANMSLTNAACNPCTCDDKQPKNSTDGLVRVPEIIENLEENGPKHIYSLEGNYKIKYHQGVNKANELESCWGYKHTRQNLL